MNDERIWAPWRLGYVAGDKTSPPPIEPAAWRPGADRECFICRAAARYDDSAAAHRLNLVVATSDQTVAMLNLYPYNNGHLLVSPVRHIGQFDQLSDEEHLDVMHVIARFTKLYRELLRADGFNIGLNLGRPAGAGVPGHLHWHLVPRWTGDGNFMPVIAGTRVISQSLEALWEAIVGKKD